MKHITKLLLTAIIFVGLTSAGKSFTSSAQAYAQTSPVDTHLPKAVEGSVSVLIYHRFGDDRYPSTNVRLDQFEAQIAWLKNNDFQFPSLEQVVAAHKRGETLPGKNILITTDDGYQSIADNGWPILKEAGIPLALFVATDPIDRGSSNYMTWDTIRHLDAEGVSIGHHGANHMHMADASADAIGDDLKAANQRFLEELGYIPTIFAWPYGEYNPDHYSVLKENGLEAAFAQYSASLGPASDLMSMPRFAINERYGAMDRFTIISNSKAMPVATITPSNPIVMDGNNPPRFAFTSPRANQLTNMACFPSHMDGAADIQFGPNGQIEVMISKAYPPGRSRVNCTAPAGNGRWYWFGRPFFNFKGFKKD